MQALGHVSQRWRADSGAVGILVEENTPVSQEVSSVTNNLDTSLGVVSVQLCKNLVV